MKRKRQMFFDSFTQRDMLRLECSNVLLHLTSSFAGGSETRGFSLGGCAKVTHSSESSFTLVSANRGKFSVRVPHAKWHPQASGRCADGSWQLTSVCDAFSWQDYEAPNPVERNANASKHKDMLRDYVPVVLLRFAKHILETKSQTEAQDNQDWQWTTTSLSVSVQATKYLSSERWLELGRIRFFIF